VPSVAERRKTGRDGGVVAETAAAVRVIPTPLGPALARADDAGVFGLTLLEPGEPPTRPPSGAPSGEAHLDHLARELDAYFAGALRRFTVPLSPRGTSFQRRVWDELTKIPFGATISYAELARRLGRPTCARCVGGASGRNPVWIVIPCHRVIGADGSLTGYAGGVHLKQALLEHEGAGASLSLFARA
jgi:methylated-DNA-[protein]-cysteine S-methyltransferase